MDSAPSSHRSVSETCLALVILWSTHEPWHAGEVAYLPAAGPTWILGRRERSPDPDTAPLAFFRHRAGAPVPAEPLGDPHLSRRHVRFTAPRAGALAVENLGRVPLLVNGLATSKGAVGPGDLLEIERRILLLIVRRAWPIPRYETALRPFSYGDVDEDGIVGESDVAWALRRRIQRAAVAAGHVLVIGASGAGKELVARAVHAHSPRGARPLVARNAATLPESLVNAELFGNAKNFPNVGTPDRPGLIGAADGSSLFLDEIGDSRSCSTAPAACPGRRGVPAAGRGRDAPRRCSRDRRHEPATHRTAARSVGSVSPRDRRPRSERTSRRHPAPRAAHRAEARAVEREASPEIMTDGPEGAEPHISTAFMRQVLGMRWETNVRELEALVWRALDQSEGPLLGALPKLPEERPEAEALADVAELAAPLAGDIERIQACLDRHNGVIEDAWRELGLSSRYVLRRLIARHGLVVRRRPGGR